MIRFFVLLLSMTVASSELVSAQATPAPQSPPTYEQQVFATWKALHDKILVMAKDTMLPDDKLGWKPHPDSRSMLDEFRHVPSGSRCRRRSSPATSSTMRRGSKRTTPSPGRAPRS